MDPMKKIQYGITGFVIGIMMGLLFGLAEMKLFRRLQHSPMLPFVMGITVIASAITGVSIRIKKARRL